MRKRLAVYTILCSAVAIAQQTPNQAFVVNTGDGTVSQIDLQNYKVTTGNHHDIGIALLF